jgi:hypothetical protein
MVHRDTNMWLPPLLLIVILTTSSDVLVVFRHDHASIAVGEVIPIVVPYGQVSPIEP